MPALPSSVASRVCEGSHGVRIAQKFRTKLCACNHSPAAVRERVRYSSPNIRYFV